MIQRYKEISIIYGSQTKDIACSIVERIRKLQKVDCLPVKAKMVKQDVVQNSLCQTIVDNIRKSDLIICLLSYDQYKDKDGFYIYSIRPNILIELGMALMTIYTQTDNGSVFLSDSAKDKILLFADKDSFDKCNGRLPSDVNGFLVNVFDSSNLEELLTLTLNHIYHYLLKLPAYSNDPRKITNKGLLEKKDYSSDYINLFLDHRSEFLEMKSMSDIRRIWQDDMNNFTHTCERIIFALQLIKCVPIIGYDKETDIWLDHIYGSVKMINNPEENTPISKSCINLLDCLVRYTKTKAEKEKYSVLKYSYEKCFKDLSVLIEEFAKYNSVNPFIMYMAYEYQGLCLLRILPKDTGNEEKRKEILGKAISSFTNAKIYGDRIDGSLESFKGWISFDLARAYGNLFTADNSNNKYKDLCLDEFSTTLGIRRQWMDINDSFPKVFSSAMAYEYYYAYLSYIRFEKTINNIQDAKSDFEIVTHELDNLLTSNNKLIQLVDLRHEFDKLKEEKIKGE